MKTTITSAEQWAGATRPADGEAASWSIRRVFLHSCVALFLATSLAKFLTLAVGSPILDLRDPVFPALSSRQMLAGAACGELALVIWLAWSRTARGKLLAVAVASGLFIVYRTGLYLDSGSFSGAMCPCLGSLGDWLHLSRESQNVLLNFVAVYLFGGSARLLALSPAIQDNL